MSAFIGPAGGTAIPPGAGAPRSGLARGPGPARIRARRLAAVLSATGAALAVWAVVGPLAGVHLAAQFGSGSPIQHVGPGMVVAVSLLAGLAGWALLALLERHARYPRRAWTALAGCALGASLQGPLAVGRGAAAITALACMHLAVAAVAIPALRRTVRR